MIPIYKSEIEDGLEKAIASKNIVASLVAINPIETPNKTLQDLAAIAADISNKQKDLFYLDTILVSTGWNGNDDVFLREETWAARHTPDNKPFNYEHKSNDIIGHIINSAPVTEDFQSVIADDIDLENLPEKFHIKTSAVLYKVWDNPELLNRMNTIIAEILEGKWFVSMEAMFHNFDYAVIDRENKHKVVARTETSAFLTKHLRVFGGTGVYENYRVGRLLRNITFSGKGLVRRPANPESIILNSFASKLEEIEIKNKESVMSVDLEAVQKELAELKSKHKELAESKASLEGELQKRNGEKVSALENTVASKDEAIATLTNELKTLKEANTKATEEIEALKGEAKKAKDEADKMKKEMTSKCRLDLVLAAGKEKADAEKLVAKFEGLNDEQFNEIVDIMKAAKPEDKKDKKDEKDAAKAGEKVLDGADAVKDVTLASAAVSDDLQASLEKTFASMFSNKSKTKNAKE